MLNALEPERVAERSIAATFTGVWDVWLWATPLEMMIFYLNQYLPDVAKRLAKDGSTKLRDAMTRDLVAGRKDA